MPSKRPVELLNGFAFDVPVTHEESEAQWRIHTGRRLTTAEYLEWCRQITADSVSHAVDLPTEPFEL